MATHIDIKNLSYSYPDGTAALKSLSLSFKEGQTHALIGANGAGKSTLLLHLNGTVLPQCGKVLIRDCEVSKKTLYKVRQQVGMVFQNPDDQLFMSTVFDDVAFGPSNMGMKEEMINECVDSALNQVGLKHLAGRHPAHLSTGEKKRISIATVLAMEPDILVLDEPSAGLDPGARRMLINLLKSFAHTKIIATHDLDMALDTADTVTLLYQGEIFAQGSPVEIFNDRKKLEQCGLEQPLSISRY
jgi:cobalt/nickel transport system ATP-binding protein